MSFKSWFGLAPEETETSQLLSAYPPLAKKLMNPPDQAYLHDAPAGVETGNEISVEGPGYQVGAKVILSDDCIFKTTSHPEPPDESSKEPELAPHGQKAFGLTRFGEVWLPMNENDLEGIDFNPEDGCACEVRLRSGTVYHLDDDEAAALTHYLLDVAASNELESMKLNGFHIP